MFFTIARYPGARFPLNQNKIISRLKVKPYLNVIVEQKEVIKKVKIGRGRPGPDVQFQEQTLKQYTLKITLLAQPLRQAEIMDGIYLLCCSLDKSLLSTEGVLQEYKGQNKVERGHRDLKGPIALTPVFLHKPERVAAITLVCVIALQLLRLMEFNAHFQLLKLDELLQDLLPNRLATSRPPAFKMLQALSTIDLLEVVTPHGSQFLLNKLSPLQLKILQLLDVPQLAYTQALTLSKFQNSG